MSKNYKRFDKALVDRGEKVAVAAKTMKIVMLVKFEDLAAREFKYKPNPENIKKAMDELKKTEKRDLPENFFEKSREALKSLAKRGTKEPVSCEDEQTELTNELTKEISRFSSLMDAESAASNMKSSAEEIRQKADVDSKLKDLDDTIRCLKEFGDGNFDFDSFPSKEIEDAESKLEQVKEFNEYADAAITAMENAALAFAPESKPGMFEVASTTFEALKDHLRSKSTTGGNPYLVTPDLELPPISSSFTHSVFAPPSPLSSVKPWTNS